MATSGLRGDTPRTNLTLSARTGLLTGPDRIRALRAHGPRCNACGVQTAFLHPLRGGICTDCAKLLGPIR